MIVSNCVLGFGQQNQEYHENFYYQIDGLVYVNNYDLIHRTRLPARSIPKSGLKFEIVRTEINPATSDKFYVIQFLPINKLSDHIGASPTTTGKLFWKKTTYGSFTLKPEFSGFINSTNNSDYYWIKATEFEQLLGDKYVYKKYRVWRPSIAYGAQVSLPFKLRPGNDSLNIKITPDLTLGGYMGLRFRMSYTKPYYVIPNITLGLASLGVNDNTSPNSDQGDGSVLGITGSAGLVFRFNDFQVGLMTGKDWAAGEIAKDWIYQGEWWYSFSIGYPFFGNKKDQD